MFCQSCTAKRKIASFSISSPKWNHLFRIFSVYISHSAATQWDSVEGNIPVPNSSSYKRTAKNTHQTCLYNLDAIHTPSTFHALILFLFHHHLHNQIPPWAVPTGKWNPQDTCPSALLSFKHHDTSLCLSLTQNTAKPYEVVKKHLLNKIHRLAVAPAAAMWESSEPLLLLPCNSFSSESY